MEQVVPLCHYMMQHSIHLWDIIMLLISTNSYYIWIIHAIVEWIPQCNRLDHWHIWYWLNLMAVLIITSPSLITSLHCLISSCLVVWTSSMQHVDSLVCHTWTRHRDPCPFSTTVCYPLICRWIQTRLNGFMRYLIVYHKWRGYLRVLPSTIILSHTLFIHWNVA